MNPITEYSNIFKTPSDESNIPNLGAPFPRRRSRCSGCVPAGIFTYGKFKICVCVFF